MAVLPILCVTLSFAVLPGGWSCWCLLLWLFLHRRIRPAHYRKARATSALLPCGPAKGHPRTKPDWVRQRVIYLAIHLNSCRQITYAFNRWYGQDASVGKSWVAQCVKAHAGEIAQRRRAMRRRLPVYFGVGHTWALDLTLFASPDGPTFTVLGIIDHGSRRLLCLKALPTKCVFALLGHVFLACASYGLPVAIRTDNESMFTSRLWGFSLKMLGILHRRSPPGQPWHNGRIERLFGTLKPLLRQIQPRSAAVLQRVLSGFSRFYNEARPHQSLGGLTPLEVWQGRGLADVQQAYAQTRRQRGQALDGLRVGCHVRC